jgi:hypothetical protein
VVLGLGYQRRTSGQHVTEGMDRDAADLVAQLLAG